MSDAEKNDGGLTRREFAKTVAAGVAAVATAHSLSGLEAHAASGSSKMTEAAAGQISSTGPKEKTAIEMISETALKVRFEDLDEQTIKMGKDRIFDLTGCIIGGAMASGNAGLVKIIRDMGGKQEAPLFIHGGRVPLGHAAMVNSISCRSNDFGVMSIKVGGRWIAAHHGETTIPTALTFSDVYNVSGKEFLTTALVGDDTVGRVLAAGEWDLKMWDGTMCLPVFGVVPIAGRFMGLSATQVRDAFGISINTIAGAIQSLWDDSLCFKLGQGLSARNGIFAAQLAKEGWTGLEDALFGGGRGFYFIYRGTNQIPHPELLTQDLGKKFYQEEFFKRFPCGNPNHAFVYAALALNKQYGLKAGDIREVELANASGEGGYYGQPFRVRASPQASGIFSFQYTTVSALLRGRLKVRDFDTEAVTAPEMLETIAKSKLVKDPTLAGGQGKVGSVRIRVTTNDGKVYEKLEEGGVADKYPTREEILSKFWDQVDAYQSVSRAKAQKILDMIDRIEDVKEMKEYTELLMP